MYFKKAESFDLSLKKDDIIPIFLKNSSKLSLDKLGIQNLRSCEQNLSLKALLKRIIVVSQPERL